MKINRWWYSKKQKEISDRFNVLGHNHTCNVLVDGEWHEYTEWTTSVNGKCNWDDAVLVAESTKELPITVNGVIQSHFWY